MNRTMFKSKIHRATVNGPAALLVQENDIVILITYTQMATEEAKADEPKVVHVDENNRVLQLGNDLAEGLTPGLLRPPVHP